jgi:hypothetical protein
MNIRTVIALIAFTVLLSGGTSKVVLDFLDKHNPKDKVYRDPEDLEDNSDDDEKSVDFEYGDFIDGNEEKSIGAISRFEKFDEDVLQHFLRKKKKGEDFDPLGEKFLEEIEMDFPFDDKDSDFPPSYVIQQKPKKHRESIFHNKTIPKKANKVQFSLPIEEDKNRQTNFLSPDTQKISRRSTIQHNKIDAAALKRYSVIASG